MNLIVLSLLVMGLAFVMVAYFKSQIKCPDPQIIYKFIPTNQIDQAYSPDNFPSQTLSNLWSNQSQIFPFQYNSYAGIQKRAS